MQNLAKISRGMFHTDAIFGDGKGRKERDRECGVGDGGRMEMEDWRQRSQMAKFDPFLSLDCARVEGVGARGAIQGKEGIKFCSAS